MSSTEVPPPIDALSSSEAGAGIARRGKTSWLDSARQPDLVCLVGAVIGIAGALGLGGAVGGAIAVLSAVLVSGYALTPVLDGPTQGTPWVPRAVVGAAAISLVLTLAVSGLSLGFRGSLATLLLLCGALVAARLLKARLATRHPRRNLDDGKRKS